MSKRSVRKRREQPVLQTQGADLAETVVTDLQPIRRLSANLRPFDADEDNVRRVLIMVLEQMARAREDEGVIFGPMAVSAEYLAEKQAELGVIDHTEVYAFKHWLLGCWGDKAREVDEFREWNQGRADRTTAFSVN